MATKRKCNPQRSYACGKSCIRKSYACRIEFPIGVSQSLSEKRRIVFDTGEENTVPRKPESTPTGKPFEDLTLDERLSAMYKKFPSELAEMDRILREEDPDSSFFYDNLMKETKSIHNKLLSQVSEDEAKAWSSQLKISGDVSQKELNALQKHLETVYRLTGGRVNANALEAVEVNTAAVNVNYFSPMEKRIQLSDGYIGYTVYHEMGHALEASHGSRFKALDSSFQFLNRVGINTDSSSSEKVYYSNFSDSYFQYSGTVEAVEAKKVRTAYAGRDYKGVATEVVSTGLELFNHPIDMAIGYENAKDHFLFTLSHLIK